MNDTTLFEEISELDLTESLANITIPTPEWLDKIVSIFSDWSAITSAVTGIIVLIVIICIVKYCFSGIKATLCWRPSGKYRVNNIRFAPPEELELEEVGKIKEESVNILSYIPQSYVTKGIRGARLPLIKVQLGDREWIALVDTGSNISYCNFAVGSYLIENCGFEPLEGVMVASLANGSQLNFSYKFNYAFNIYDQSIDYYYKLFNVDLYVANINHFGAYCDMVLGCDFLSKFNQMGMDLNVNFVTGKIKAGNHSFELIKFGPTIPSASMTVREAGGLPKIPIFVNGTKITALVDSGCSITYCKKSIAKMIQNAWLPINTKGKAANGSCIHLYGQFWAPFDIANVKLTSRVLVSDDKDCPFDMILGTDLLENINKMGIEIKINLAEGIISFDDSAIQLINAISITDDIWENNEQSLPEYFTVRISENYILEPHTDNLIKAIVDALLKQLRNGIRRGKFIDFTSFFNTRRYNCGEFSL